MMMALANSVWLVTINVKLVLMHLLALPVTLLGKERPPAQCVLALMDFMIIQSLFVLLVITAARPVPSQQDVLAVKVHIIGYITPQQNIVPAPLVIMILVHQFANFALILA